jgi:hypothetical protein
MNQQSINTIICQQSINTIICLILPHCCVCPKPGSGFVVVYLVFIEWRREVIVDIGGIVDHQCLNLLWITLVKSVINWKTKMTTVGKWVIVV